MHFPPPELRPVEGFTLIDDSQVGTKTRIIHALVEQAESDHIILPTTPVGASPAIMAEKCKDMGKRLTLLSTQIARIDFTPALLKALDFGANIRTSPDGDFSLVEKWAQSMAHEQNGYVPDFNGQVAMDCVTDMIADLNIRPKKFYSASARFAMARAAQKACPDAEHVAIAVLKLEGADPGTAEVIYTDTPYEEAYRGKMPFLCNAFYEAKAWHEMKKRENPSENIFFLNPAGPN